MPMTLLVGGARSGKSGLAVRMAEASGLPVAFVATGEALDEEMAERIARHRAERPGRWRTIEAPRDVLGALEGIDRGHFVILDCLTLWTANLLDCADSAILAAEDGLADAFDGLGAGRNRSQTLEIMRDSRLGTFGAAALAMSLLLQVSALTALVALPAGAAVVTAAAAHSSSRLWAALAMALPRASPDGLAAGLDYNSRRRAVTLRFLIGLAIAAALLRSDTWVLAPAGRRAGWWPGGR